MKQEGFKDKKKSALLLSGGGAKAAAFHVGVCIALAECGFSFAGGDKARLKKKKLPQNDPMTFQNYIGSSAGAVIAAILASGFSVYSLIDAFLAGSDLQSFNNQRKSSKKDSLKPISYRDIFALNKGAPSQILSNLFQKKPVIRGGLEVLFKKNFQVSGIFSTRNLGRYLKRHVFSKDRFEDLSVELSIVATRLDYSEQTVFSSTKKPKKLRVSYKNHVLISDAVCASATLPPLFSPYGIENEDGDLEYYFDGEIRDTLPTFIAEEKGADLIVASSSIEPYEFNPEMGSLSQYGVPLIVNQAIYQMIHQKIASDTHTRHNYEKLVKHLEDLLKTMDIQKSDKTKIMDTVLKDLSYNPNTTYIYIHPSPKDYQMFFYDHFSLSEKVLSQIVRVGFKAAMHALRPYVNVSQFKHKYRSHRKRST